jgi:hypothetical protein
VEFAMTDPSLAATLAMLLAELANGAREEESYVLNGGDPGLLASLEALDAAAASRLVGGASSIAAHVEHVRYGLSLMNRWAGGDPNPWATADWTASWRMTTVSDGEWAERRAALRDELRRWADAIRSTGDLEGPALAGVIASVVHLAYHLGAMRQMDRSIRGPSAEE